MFSNFSQLHLTILATINLLPAKLMLSVKNDLNIFPVCRSKESTCPLILAWKKIGESKWIILLWLTQLDKCKMAGGQVRILKFFGP